MERQTDGETPPPDGPSPSDRRQPVHNPFDVTWQERAIVLGAVFGGIALLIAGGLVFAYEHTMELIALVPISFFAAGKFLPLWALRENSTFNPYELGIVIGIMDTVTVLVIVYSLEALYKLGPVGRFLEKTNRNAALVLGAYPWMRKWALTGIVLFVLFPVAGTGAIGGTFIGALLGLHRFRLIAAVSFGGFLGGLSMAFLAVRFGEAIEELKGNWILIGLMIALVLFGIWGMSRAYKNALARARESGLSQSGFLRDLHGDDAPRK